MQLLSNRSQLAAWIGEYAPSSQIRSGLAAADGIVDRLSDEQPAPERRALFKQFFRSITLTTIAIRFGVNVPAIVQILVNGEAGYGSVAVALEMPILLKRRGDEQRLIVDSSFAPTRNPDAATVDLIAKAHLLFGKLTERPGTSITDIVKSLGIDREDVGRILPLVFLALKVVEAVLQGRQSQNYSPRNLARMHLPLLWAEQAAAIKSTSPTRITACIL